AVLLPPDYRVTTSLYVNGRVDAGVLHGDLILYGRGDPTWSARCFAVDTLAPGVCDSTFTAIDAIADSVRAKGIRRITGKLGRDGNLGAEGTVALGRKTRVESVALPDPNLYAARALAASLARRGVAVEGGAAGTTDSLTYRTVRCCAPPLLDFRGRPLPDVIFPILNSSQNWFAEMLLKMLGRVLKG